MTTRPIILTLVLALAACGGGGGDEESASTTTTSVSSSTTTTTTTDDSSTTTEPTVGASDARFDEAHLAAGVDTSADAPDPSTYTDTFAADESGIYAVYLLDEDAEVEITWSRAGEELFQDSQQVPGGRWAQHHITPPAGGFPPGEWQVVLEIVGGSDREVLTFTVTA